MSHVNLLVTDETILVGEKFAVTKVNKSTPIILCY